MRDTSHRLKRVYSFAARHSSAPALRTRATTFAFEQLRLFDAIDSPTILRFYDFTFAILRSSESGGSMIGSTIDRGEESEEHRFERSRNERHRPHRTHETMRKR